MPTSATKTASSKIDRRRRRHPRYRGDFPVTVSYFQGDEHRKLVGRCRDISKAGIGILVGAELTSGEVAGLSFSLPGSNEPWELQAVIRYCRSCHYGFEFLALTGEQRDILEKYFKGREAIE
jgi:hypothetical protein